ncbi:helix-turn-helix transcriptional regulator [Burkholderia plantarii]|uniref:helix-turn-helix transcriptional regulator n=1 Tax=Burkholderia plantarii TaxID=41899 RepID=UPI0018DBCD2E|nr:AraC family transcriptional regulator [Burkholderia plantarii]MBI0329225.1 AraC family transcriptional regulator [Burkholderia plantarii]
MKDRVEYTRSRDVPGLVLGDARFSDFRFDRHYHLDFHVGVVTEGVQRQQFAGRSVLLGPGSVSIMPPGEVHDGTRVGDGAYTLKTFRLPTELMASVIEELSGRPGEPALRGVALDDPSLAQRLGGLHAALRVERGAAALGVQSAWLTLLERLFAASGALTPRELGGALPAAQWARVRDYCEAHLADKITLDELAALCGVDRFVFLKLFKRTTAMTPHAWLVRLRLERACLMLHRGTQSIAEVAQAVGFYDQSHFNRAFRRAFGCAPSRY